MLLPVVKSIRLLTASLAFLEAPNLKTGLSVHDAAEKLLKSPPKRFASLADDLAAKAEKLFEDFPDTPADAPALFAQMIETSLPDKELAIQAKLDPVQATKAMLSKLSSPEYLRDPMPELFTVLVTPTLKEFFSNRDIIAELTPSLWAGLLQTQDAIHRTASDTNARVRDMQGDMQDMKAMMTAFLSGKTLTLDAMTVLAARFGEHDITDAGSLQVFLSKKAEEYQALRAQAAAIPETYQRLSNLKSGAIEAIEALNLDEAADLLASVRNITKEEDAKAAELQADVELLRGRVEVAYELLCDAAYSFRITDPAEPANRLITDYVMRIGTYGMQYGGVGLDLSIQMAREAATTELRGSDPWLWGAAKNAEALGLQNKSKEVGGEAGLGLLSAAQAAYLDVLSVHTRDEYPVSWITAKTNLAIAMSDHAARLDGSESAALFNKAIQHCLDAVTACDTEKGLQDWIFCKGILASTLVGGSDRMPDEFAAQNLAEAVEIYKQILALFPTDGDRIERAGLLQNLGSTLSRQADFSNSLEARTQLADAIKYLSQAETEVPRGGHPLTWASIQSNIGIARLRLANLTISENTETHFRQAISHFNNALEIRKPDDQPLLWAHTQENISIALLDLVDSGISQSPSTDLDAALEAVEAALTVFDPEHMSYNHAKATRLRDDIQTALAKLDP